MNTYFSTFIPGLGDVVKDQLVKELQNFGTDLFLDGLIVYHSNSPAEKIKDTRFVNNSFLLLRQYKNLRGEPIAAMAKIVLNQSLPEIEFSGRTFRIVFSFANELVSVQKRLLGKLEEKVSSRYRLSIDRTNPACEFWLLYREEGYGFFGLRLTKHPDWKKILAKGQLRPELANILCLLSEPSVGDIVLDPFAGSGAITKERKRFPHKSIVAGDIYPKDGSVKKLDALNLKQFQTGSVDKIITDPPWGISVGLNLNLEIFYIKMLQELYRVLKPSGLLIILIGKKELFESVLDKFQDRVYLKKKYDILVSGKKAAVYKIAKL